MKQLYTFIIILLFFAAQAQSDTIELKSGSLYTSIVRVTNGENQIHITDFRGKIYPIDKGSVKRVILGDAITSLIGWTVYTSKYANAAELTGDVQPPGDTILSYTQVVIVDSNLSKDELYNRGRRWFANAFRNSTQVMQVEDKVAGELIGKGVIKYNTRVFMGSTGLHGWIRFTVKVNTRPGRYKFSFTDFTHEGSPSPGMFGGSISNDFGTLTSAVECPDANCPPSRGPRGWRNNVWNDLKENVEATIPSLINSLKADMGKPAQKDDW